MGFTVHFNAPMTIGLCLIPGSILVFFLLGAIFSSLELGAVAIGGVGAIATLVAGIVLLVLGIGMSIH